MASLKLIDLQFGTSEWDVQERKSDFLESLGICNLAILVWLYFLKLVTKKINYKFLQVIGDNTSSSSVDTDLPVLLEWTSKIVLLSKYSSLTTGDFQTWWFWCLLRSDLIKIAFLRSFTFTFSRVPKINSRLGGNNGSVAPDSACSLGRENTFCFSELSEFMDIFLCFKELIINLLNVFVLWNSFNRFCQPRLLLLFFVTGRLEMVSFLQLFATVGDLRLISTSFQLNLFF